MDPVFSPGALSVLQTSSRYFELTFASLATDCKVAAGAPSAALCGLPASFSAADSDRLGLQIVRTLVSAELGGTLEIGDRGDGKPGARATIGMVLARRPVSAES